MDVSVGDFSSVAGV